ncbi:MAG TPA: cysteine peptidase family C39 domain-containing protein, partial [Chitinophagaceae bacterium]|nr:cysteine peptidase family C39 domain-containing protein [Chitinophagaceae bacterium]
MDCGPTCLWMVCKHYGKSVDIDQLKEAAQIGKRGVSLLGLSEAAEKTGFRTLSVEIPFNKLIEEAPLPCIVHWRQNHFVVLTPRSTSKRVTVADPAHGLVHYNKEEFKEKWTGTADEVPGIALLLEPMPSFHELKDHDEKKMTWQFLGRYLLQYKRYYFQLLLGVVIASGLQLMFPFLTQNIVDVGISTKNLNYVYLILLAQFFLFSGRVMTDFLRSRILLFIGTRVNISILSDFWIKLMKLPVSYFDIKKAGDIIQRLGDHGRLQQFLTATSLSTLFSSLNIVVFSIALLLYDTTIYMVFIAGSILYFLWIKLFLKYRRKLDVQRFNLASMENSATMQLVMGIQEIRLTNSEKKRRWEWERIQAALYRLSFRQLSLSQYQQAGAFFINEGKNIVI